MTRPGTTALGWAMGARCLAVIATVMLVACEAGDKETQSAGQEAQSIAAESGSRPEPEFEPGIPGMKMVDVRDYKFLWRELDQLQIWERGDRLSVAEYRSKAIEKTAHFLELEGDAEEQFVAAASEAVVSLRESFRQRQPSGRGNSGRKEEVTFSSKMLSSGMDAAVNQVTLLLHDEPRHRLFAPECRKWLLKLAFGPSEAKEAREVKEAQQA